MARGSVKRLWRETGYLVEPKNTRDVMAMIGAVGTHSTGQRFAWRGLSSADYTVLSSLHRDLGVSSNEASVRKAEDETISRAHEWGLGVAKLGLVDDFQLLADLQHYGVPTRLIDVTSDPITALWFACQRPSAEDVILDGLIVAINTTSYGHTLALTPADGTYATLGATHSSSRSKALSQPQPFTVRAAEANPRLASQAGFFISGAVPDKPTDVFPSIAVDFSPHPGDLNLLATRGRGRPKELPFVAILIPNSIKGKLLASLDGTYNKSARTLFPDFSGFREFGQRTGSREPSKAV